MFKTKQKAFAIQMKRYAAAEEVLKGKAKTMLKEFQSEIFCRNLWQTYVCVAAGRLLLLIWRQYFYYFLAYFFIFIQRSMQLF